MSFVGNLNTQSTENSTPFVTLISASEADACTDVPASRALLEASRKQKRRDEMREPCLKSGGVSLFVSGDCARMVRGSGVAQSGAGRAGRDAVECK